MTRPDFLIFATDFRGQYSDGRVGAYAHVVTGDEGETAEHFAARWYEDRSILRIYELRLIDPPDVPRDRKEPTP